MKSVLKNVTYCGSYVFTDFQSNDELGTSTAREYQEVATARGSRFIPIVLRCGLDENERRMVGAGRKELVGGGKGLLLDVDLLRSFRVRTDIHSFGTPEELCIDVTRRDAGSVAEEIALHIRTIHA